MPREWRVKRRGKGDWGKRKWREAKGNPTEYLKNKRTRLFSRYRFDFKVAITCHFETFHRLKKRKKKERQYYCSCGAEMDSNSVSPAGGLTPVPRDLERQEQAAPSSKPLFWSFFLFFANFFAKITNLLLGVVASSKPQKSAPVEYGFHYQDQGTFPPPP